MAIKLVTNYSKKLGLPAYSSHSFSASVEIELIDLSQVEAECAKLYALLQQSVDREIQEVGFVPDPAQYGSQRNGHARPQSNGHHGNGVGVTIAVGATVGGGGLVAGTPP